MRLICPNCGAQYEVAEDVIPEAGRDVQCSNCGHTWFEQPGASVADEDGDARAAAALHADLEPDISPVPNATIPEPQPAPEPDPVPAAEPEPEPIPEPAPAEPPVRQELSSDITDILRQEAEFEQSARLAEQNALETQPDFDLSHDIDETYQSPRPQEPAEAPAEERAAPMAAAAVSAVMHQEVEAPRRELLPDIEEINSSLRPDAAPTETDYAEDEPRPRSGFRRGFMLMVLLALIALALYIFAPQISAAVPQVEPALTSYVNWVDAKRIWLDMKVQGFLEQADAGATADTAADAVEDTPAVDTAPADITTDAPEVPAEPEAEADAAPEG